MGKLNTSSNDGGSPLMSSYNRDTYSDEITTADKRRDPRSPGRKISDILLSPARYVKKKFRPGGVKGSIFTLITAILGSGTVTLPYLAAKNGIVLATLLIIFGAAISYFAGMLLVRCAEKVGSDKYEDFANY